MAMRLVKVLLPPPDGPKIRACARSDCGPICRFSRNGIAPDVVAHSSAGEPGGYIGQGASASPVQTPDSGIRSLAVRVWIGGRRTLLSVSPGSEPSHASVVLVSSIRAPKPEQPLMIFEIWSVHS